MPIPTQPILSSSEIEKIEQNPNISNTAKQFFARLKESVNSNDSFEDFQAKLTNLILDNTDKEIIFRILIDNLGVIIEDDLNAILTQLKGVLYPQEPTPEELDRIRRIILEIIQESENFKVIKSELNPNGFLEFKGLDEEGLLDRAAKFTISFDVTTTDDNGSKNWALVDKTDADDIQIEIVRGQENWIFGGKEEQGITPRWNFICKQGLQLQDRTEILRFSISNLKTQLLSGYANLYVHYENIPGYWDGYITVPIHKGPLVYREYKISEDDKIGCVGIGTDEPQAKLHVKSLSGVDGLKVEGDTAIEGDLLVLKGDNPVLKIWKESDSATSATIQLREQTYGGFDLKYDGSNHKFHVESYGIQGLKGKHLTIERESGNVGIGTTNPGSNKLKVEGKTAIAGNLSVTNGRLGIGSSDFAKEPLVIRAQGRQEGLIAFEDRNGNKKWHIEQNYGGNTPGLNFVETGVKDFRFFIQRGGNVGIGTSNPNYALEVNGDISVGVRRSDSSTNKYGARLHFNGAPLNTDPIWMARYNHNPDQTHLRINLSDDSGTNDRLEIGYTKNQQWSNHYYIDRNGAHNSSDARLKTDINTINDSLNLVKQLRGVKFDWKHNIEKGKDHHHRNFGFIAQELEQVIPQVVSTDENGFKFVNCSALIPFLIEAIKEQQHQLDKFHAEIQDLKGLTDSK